MQQNRNLGGMGETTFINVLNGLKLLDGKKVISLFCVEKLRNISRLFGVSTCLSLNPATCSDEAHIQDKSSVILNENSQSRSQLQTQLSLDVYSVDFCM